MILYLDYSMNISASIFHPLMYTKDLLLSFSSASIIAIVIRRFTMLYGIIPLQSIM